MTKFEELAKVWGQDKANEFKERFLYYYNEYKDDIDDVFSDAAHILARVLTNDEAEFSEDFYDYYDVLGLGDGNDIDVFAADLVEELI